MVVLCVALVAVCLPRFNRQDLLIKNWTGGTPADSAEYVEYVRVFRGEPVLSNVTAPFVYRPLAPWLASFLPFKPTTSLNLVNLAALILCIPLLDVIQRRLGISPQGRVVGCALFVFSFPTFYYGTIGYVDPVALLFVTAGLAALLADRWGLVFLATAAGIATKESTFVLLPAVLVQAICPRAPSVVGLSSSDPQNAFLTLASYPLPLTSSSLPSDQGPCFVPGTSQGKPGTKDQPPSRSVPRPLGVHPEDSPRGVHPETSPRGERIQMRGLVLALGLTLVCITEWLLLRVLADVPPYHWSPATDRCFANMSRPQLWLGAVLTLGIPVMMLSGLLRRGARTCLADHRREVMTLLAGTVAALALFGWATVSAYADARSLWFAYPFLIPLCGLAWQGRKRIH